MVPITALRMRISIGQQQEKAHFSTIFFFQSSHLQVTEKPRYDPSAIPLHHTLANLTAFKLPNDLVLMVRCILTNAHAY